MEQESGERNERQREQERNKSNHKKYLKLQNGKRKNKDKYSIHACLNRHSF